MGRQISRKTAKPRAPRAPSTSRNAASGSAVYLPAPRAKSETLDALRRSRVAVQQIETELDDILDDVRDPRARIDSRAPDRLRKAANEASAAMAEVAPSWHEWQQDALF